MVISGLATGLLYSLLGVALSLVYRTGGILNLAMGPLAFVAALVSVVEVPGTAANSLWALAAAAVLGGVLSGLTYLLLVRQVEANGGAFRASVATLGAGLIASAVIAWIWGSQVHAAPNLDLGSGLTIGGTFISPTDVATGAVVGILFVALASALKFTRLGLHIRAIGQGPLTSSMLGLPVTRIRTLIWGVAGMLAASAAFISAGRSGLVAGNENNLLVAALAGLVVGGFDSLLGVALGGILLGLIENILAYYVASWLQAVSLLIVVVVVLMSRPNGLIGRHPGNLSEASLPRRSRLVRIEDLPRPQLSTSIFGMFIVVGFVLWVARAGSFSTVAGVEAAIPFAIMILGMYIVIGLSGQLVLGQGAFAAGGAYAAGILAAHSSLGLEVSLPLGFAVGAFLGIMIGTPCSRLGTVYLSVVTLVFGSAVSELALHLGVTGGANGLALPPPRMFGYTLTSPTGVISLELVIFLVLAGLVALLRRSFFGLDLIVGRDASRAAQTSGARVVWNRIAAFSLAAGVTGIGGVLYAETVGLISPELFDFSFSLNILAAQVVGGMDSILGSIVGGGFLGGVPQATSGLKELPNIIFGGALILVLMLAPSGLTSLVGSVAERVRQVLHTQYSTRAGGRGGRMRKPSNLSRASQAK
ncbi:ABC transporter permease [Acidiferrimicrobium sp. IK]|uniref:ABC transporter permease n=1 Tax=Acidiferrimicrobium sp. IK TaxID=2871700 RepID=UPI0021CB4D61|nr:ABC transporter permease [Acidiferrimicrobium sp. IK]MCU4183892.1 ABC transporter permease [Acidiferrimicrobium sp. IK]